jgi:HEAT repeat protein
MLGLDDPDDIVRERTLASLPKLEVAPTPELTRTLEGLLKDPNISISTRAAAVLVHFGNGEAAQELLTALLKENDIHCKRTTLDAIHEIGRNTKGVLPFQVDPILDMLEDVSPAVRRDAIRVAALLDGESVYAAIAGHLADEDAEVRRSASESLKQAWAQSRSVVLPMLEQKRGLVVSAALDAIPVGAEEALVPLRSYIQREVSSIRYYRAMIASVPRKGRATFLLLEALRHRELGCEERLMKAVGLFGNASALDLIRKSLNAGDTSTRAAALEALEMLGDKRITREVLPILDRGGVFGGDDDETMNTARVVEVLLSQDDPWIRALGTYIISELKLKSFTAALHTLYSDPSPLVRDSAHSAIAKMDGAIKMKAIKNLKTLKTLSALDRMLLLREVPIFSNLDPVDLEKIADVAEEQLFFDQSLVCREGEPGNTMFIIATGTVDVVKRSGTGETVLATRSVGEFVGEMAILESAPRSATLKARGDVRVLIIDGDAFNTILHDRPQVAVSVLKHMSTRVRELNERVGMAG